MLAFIKKQACLKMQQGAHLSQSDSATLLITEYFAKSFKVTQGHSKRHSCSTYV